MSDVTFMDFSQLKERFSKVSWLVKGLIPAEAIGVFFGETGSYKSFIALDLSLHIANGLDWCGRKTNRGSVFFIAGEGGAGLFHRIEAWHIDKNLKPEESNFFVFPAPIALEDAQNAKHIANLIEDQANKSGVPSLIVIDTLSQNFSGEENSSSDIAELLRTLSTEIKERFIGSSILIIHHTGHNNQERMRGASSLLANVDFCFKLTGSLQQSSVEAVKMKDAEKPEDLFFTLEKIELGFDEDEQVTLSLVAHYQPDRLQKTNPRKHLIGKHSRAFFEAISKLNGCSDPAALFEKFVALSDPELSRESCYKAFKRELTKQQEIGSVLFENGLIKLTEHTSLGHDNK